jgi:hypothetical protein
MRLLEQQQNFFSTIFPISHHLKDIQYSDKTSVVSLSGQSSRKT